MKMNVGIIGAGSMGTALAQTIAPNSKVLLYARRKAIADKINKTHFNSEYFPNVKLNNNIKAVNNLDELKDAEIIFLCIPSSAMRETITELNNIINNECIYVNTAKGIEKGTNYRMTEIIQSIIKRDAVSFSGPNIASEMVNNFPASTTIASNNIDYLIKVKKVLSTDTFKVNTNTDVIGTEFCGIIKNIIAISQGILEGIALNNNAKFTVFTQSYNEAKDIIEKLGGDRDTVDDYCGFGDIITASTLTVSRNHTLGVLSGKGIVIDEKATGIIFEGKNTVKILKKMCEKMKIESHTVNFTYDVIINKNNPKKAFYELWDKL